MRFGRWRKLRGKIRKMGFYTNPSYRILAEDAPM
jgi:hypothetical protein